MRPRKLLCILFAAVAIAVPSRAQLMGGSPPPPAVPISPANGGSGIGSPTAHSIPVAEGASNYNLVTSPGANGYYGCGFNVTASAAVDPTCALAGIAVNAISGNYSLNTSTDRSSYQKLSGGTIANLTLPQITGNGASNYSFVTQNLNSGTLTFTANAADKIDGSATGGSATVLTNWAAFFYQDSSSAPGNWWSLKVPTFAAFGSGCTLALTWSTSTGFGCAPAIPLNNLISPTGAMPMFANGNNPFVMTSAQTTNSQTAVAFNEATAATGTTDVQVGVSTLANSTSVGFNLSCGASSTVFPTSCFNWSQGANTGATNVPFNNGSLTWNNASLSGLGQVINVTCTAAAANSKFFDWQVGGVSKLNLMFSTANCGAPVLTLSGVLTATTSQSATYESTGAATLTTVAGGLGTTSNNGTAASVLVQGSDNSNTGASTAGGAATVRGGNLTGAATNLPGADLLLAGGLGTGNSTSSHVKVQMPSFSATSGTTAQTQITRYTVHQKAGSLTSATATNMFNVALAANQTGAFQITVSVSTTQATPHNCETTETFFAAIQDTAATITSQTTAGTIATICDTGTLTLAAAFSAAAPSVFSVTPTWATVVPTAVIITVEIHNLSQQEIALL